ncbi:hypothetical protein [Corynebacterium sp.]|uniref:hypothetical protein n=1 Tax=Corynebacterium sp. TaxID=1720 RepID=UPI0028AAA04C|nr:hypothetical protein [Corynebacterium sp.]
MSTSKIIVDAYPFARALKAAIAVAPRKMPRDLVQFRIEGSSLFIGANSGWEVFCAELPANSLALDEERDSVFEITRSEAIAMAAMKMTHEDSEDIPQLGMEIHKTFVQRTDESGLGLGLRSVKVKRHGELYQAELGNIPYSTSLAQGQKPTKRKPQMFARQWATVSSVAKALDADVQVWSTSAIDADVVRNVLTIGDAHMVVLTSTHDAEESGEQPQQKSQLSFEDEEGNDAEEAGTAKVAANPPKGLA